MTTKNINGVISVLPVKEFDRALDFYTRLFEREPDIIPMDGVAEWQLLEGAWIQLSVDPEKAGSTSVVITVTDIDKHHHFCESNGLPIGDIIEYPGVIKLAEVSDPEGNKVSFVQDISQ
ncbi:VOC family protein [Alteromonas confluentis]|uniref:VOC domain-containing protein n=1 Tax=Alteromonas confluentis TaxID=1656094 RepID=A0A1E7Z5F6_9ALTE|nr:hypothetical protein [Alteromonas confluentis]OFC68789.1 hypothetical protein BFC18_00710 [Alteromonas confluentis]